MADNARPDGDRAVHVIQSRKILVVAGHAESSGGILNKHAGKIRTVRIMAALTVVVGDGGMNNLLILQRMATGTQIATGMREPEQVLFGIGVFVAVQATDVRRRVMTELTVDVRVVAGSIRTLVRPAPGSVLGGGDGSGDEGNRGAQGKSPDEKCGGKRPAW